MVNSDKADEVDFVIIPGEPAKVILPVPIHSSQLKQNEPVIFGNCMWPWLSSGDRLRVEQVPSSTEIKEGWVVVFEWEGKTLSHRVTKVEGDHFWARGDIGRAAQGPIHRSKLLGRVVAYRRNESWNSLEGEFHRLGGLAYSGTMHFVLDVVEQWPVIKRLWKGAWLGSKLSKQIGAVVTTALMGNVVVTQETRSEVIYGILQSDRRLVGNESAEIFQRTNRVTLFVAHAGRGVQLGCAVLYKFSSRNKTALVRLSLVNALVMPLGVEKELYTAIACAAQHEGIQRLLISVAKERCVRSRNGTIAGYHQTAAKTLGARIRKALATADREEIFYEKLL